MRKFSEFIFSKWLVDVGSDWDKYDGILPYATQVACPFVMFHSLEYALRHEPRTHWWSKAPVYRRYNAYYKDPEEAVNAYHEKLALEKSTRTTTTTTKRRGL
jgi:hypothetical protein